MVMRFGVSGLPSILLAQGDVNRVGNKVEPQEQREHERMVVVLEGLKVVHSCRSKHPRSRHLCQVPCLLWTLEL